MNTKKPFFSGNVAYTTPSGRMHLGHGLGQITTDIAVRFSAMRNGQKPFFPFAMHSTGRDLVKIIKQISGNGDISETLKRYNISEEERKRILANSDVDSQVGALVEVYKGQYMESLSQLGTCVDFNTFFSSHQKENQRFTQWTLRKLQEKGLIVETTSQRPYCVECDEVKAIEKDLSEVSARGKVIWDVPRIQDGKINGGEFYCRLHSDTPITVKKTNERAIDYSNPQMQDKTIEMMRGMKVFPEKHSKDLEGIIRTRKAKPFERKPNEMVGAVSPFDSSRRVEALADSNIYMEFHPIAEMVNRGEIKLENLNDDLFNFIYLGQGNLEQVSASTGLNAEKVSELSDRVREVYPIDLSVIGFEHKDVHLPFSLFTHAAVLPKSFFFDEYVITGHITNEGEKMSKSKGNVVYLDETINDILTRHPIEGVSKPASLDSLRFFLAYYQYLDKDFDWSHDTFVSVGVTGVKRFVHTLKDSASLISPVEEKPAPNTAKQKWLSTSNERAIEEATQYMERRNHRDALIASVDTLGKALRSHISGNDHNANLVRRVVSTQLGLTYPIMPRISGELSEKLLGNRDVVWPTADKGLIFPEEFEEEEHNRNGYEYVKSYAKRISAEVGRLIGRKELKDGDYVLVGVPANYVREILSKEKLRLPANVKVEYSLTDSGKIKVEKRI